MELAQKRKTQGESSNLIYLANFIEQQCESDSDLSDNWWGDGKYRPIISDLFKYFYKEERSKLDCV